mmetsp:Transcript_33032/g.94391  ORF Transcript_33032/g.94391 Transcript_33032/m.94391 type:complete len:246 (+) Transcript_33032:513-1250(+)
MGGKRHDGARTQLARSGAKLRWRALSARHGLGQHAWAMAGVVRAVLVLAAVTASNAKFRAAVGDAILAADELRVAVGDAGFPLDFDLLRRRPPVPREVVDDQHADGGPEATKCVGDHELLLVLVVVREEAAEQETEGTARLPHRVPDAVDRVLGLALLVLDGVGEQEGRRGVGKSETDAVEGQSDVQNHELLVLWELVRGDDQHAIGRDAQRGEPECAEDDPAVVHGYPCSPDQGCGYNVGKRDD